LIPIEVKYQSQITKYDTKQIIKFSKKYNINRAVIVTKNLFDERNMDSVKILFIPAWLFLSDWEKIITEF
jgi:predicted AAA+ superfamily ATPase